MNEQNGWKEYQRLVLSELERHSSLIESLRSDVAQVRTDIAMLKVKSGIWGAIAGTIPVLIAVGMKYL